MFQSPDEENPLADHQRLYRLQRCPRLFQSPDEENPLADFIAGFFVNLFIIIVSVP